MGIDTPAAGFLVVDATSVLPPNAKSLQGEAGKYGAGGLAGGGGTEVERSLLVAGSGGHGVGLVFGVWVGDGFLGGLARGKKLALGG